MKSNLFDILLIVDIILMSYATMKVDEILFKVSAILLGMIICRGYVKDILKTILSPFSEKSEKPYRLRSDLSLRFN